MSLAQTCRAATQHVAASLCPSPRQHKNGGASERVSLPSPRAGALTSDARLLRLQRAPGSSSRLPSSASRLCVRADASALAEPEAPTANVPLANGALAEPTPTPSTTKTNEAPAPALAPAAAPAPAPAPTAAAAAAPAPAPAKTVASKIIEAEFPSLLLSTNGASSGNLEPETSAPETPETAPEPASEPAPEPVPVKPVESKIIEAEFPSLLPSTSDGEGALSGEQEGASAQEVAADVVVGEGASAAVEVAANDGAAVGESVAAAAAAAASTAEVLSGEVSEGESSGWSDSEFYAPQFELLSAAKVLPHPAKVEKGGEDAFLISDIGAGVICVADGVGGWANDGVDPALYSKELVYHVQAATEDAECQEDLEPRQLLLKAHAATMSPGASTAVVAVFDGERSTLEVANLGDSGLMVIRNGEVLFKTPSQQHFFDCPFQLGSESSDSPNDADVFSIEVVVGDTIVMGSDGLFDNVYDKDIACVVKVFGGRDSEAMQRSATALAALASKHASDPEYMSPYVEEALRAGKDLPIWEKMLGKKLSGGKLDDITVVVSQVVKTGDAATAE